MPIRLRSAIGAAGALVAATILLSGCEQLVYRDRPLFNPPPDSTNGFLGYANAATQQTTCGTCHSGKQEEWAGTKHSHAWADLIDSGHATDTCKPCHATDENGNSVTVPAGFNVVPDSVYFDVQCEACHGPGVNHIQSAESVKPLASIAADTGYTNGCSACHTGSHNPYVDEWVESAHGYNSAFPAESNRDPCQNCHEGRRGMAVSLAGLDPRPSGIVVDLGVYKEASDPNALQPITCAVCHDPHDATNPGQLRMPVGTTDTTELCYRCHHRETAPENGAAPRRGPHGAQGAIVLDEDAGWTPPNWPYTDRILPTHSTNDRGCAACHVTPYTGKDASGNSVFYTGHFFAAIPCINQSTGLPEPDSTCTDAQRYFDGCAVSGCHGSADAARSAYAVLQARMDYLTDQLWYDTNGNGVMETTDGGLLPKVLAQANAANNLDVMNLYDTTLTPAEGAIWNAQLAATDNRAYWRSFKISGQHSGTSSNTAHRSSGGGVHNPFFLEALLTETIKAMENQYGVSPSAPIDLTMHMAPPSGLKTARH